MVSTTPGVSGVSVRFNDVINAASIHLYDATTTTHTTLLPPDVTLVGAKTGAVAGSLVFDADLMGFTFLKTGAPLAADTYTLTLLSGANGFADKVGQLDGKATGVPGSGNYVTSFTVSPSTAAVLAIPDFIRGPGQVVNYAVGGTGVPLTLSNAAGITRLAFHIDYDPTLLTITGATTAGAPAGSTLVVNVATPGHATFVFTAAAALGTGPVTLGAITASVPSTAVYGTRQVLKLGIDSVSGGTAIADNALEVVGFLGDADGNAQYDANDAALVQRVVVKSDSGFAAWPDVDPVIVADVYRHGALISSDATLISQHASGVAWAQYFPALPPGTITPNPTVLVTGLTPPAPVSIIGHSAASLSLSPLSPPVPGTTRSLVLPPAPQVGTADGPALPPLDPAAFYASPAFAADMAGSLGDQASDAGLGGSLDPRKKQPQLKLTNAMPDFSLTEASNAAPSWKLGFVTTADKNHAAPGLSGICVTL